MKPYLDQDEVQRLEDAATNLRDKLLIRLLSHPGCRVLEALAIEVKDIDFKEETVTIWRLKFHLKLTCPQCGSKLGKSSKFCSQCGKKVEEAIVQSCEHRKMRPLPLDADTLAMIREYVDRGGPIERDGKLLIFGIGRGQVWRVISQCARKAGLGPLVYTKGGRTHNVSPRHLRNSFVGSKEKEEPHG